jgi:hypothetical protein
MDCAVCFETDKTVACGCGFVACRPCIKKYLLGDNNDAQCMSCRRGMTRADLVEMLGPTFVSGQYKTHREKVLYDRERALLPATQTRLANYRVAKELMLGLPAKKAELRVLKLKVDALTLQISADQNAFRRLVNTRYANRRPAQTAAARASNNPPEDRILCGCPVPGCNGFALANTRACGTCGIKICKQCHATETEGHACDPADVETARMVQRETKPCPRCSVPIFRSSGCYQMFCTQCQCVFDWGDGKEIRNGTIHNPHYFEWLERTGGRGRRLPAECGGGGFGGVYNILREVKFTNHVTDEAYRSVSTRVRDAIHVREVAVPRLHTPDIVRDNTVLRLKFLDNDITEKEFKSTLQRNEKRWSKEWELRQILEMYAEAVAAIVNNIGEFDENRDQATISVHDVTAAIEELDALDEYTNAQLSRMSKVFGMNCQPITAYGHR